MLEHNAALNIVSIMHHLAHLAESAGSTRLLPTCAIRAQNSIHADEVGGYGFMVVCSLLLDRLTRGKT